MSLKLLELMEGAMRLVKDHANVQPGEKVLILTDTSDFAHPMVVEAIAVVSKEAGADVTVATSRQFDPRVEEPPAIIGNAMLAADVIFDIGAREALFHARVGRIAFFEYGVKIISVLANSPELLSSEWARFPIELLAMIYRKTFEKVHAAKTIRVTSPGGTDLTSAISPSHIMGFTRDDVGWPVYPAPKGVPILAMWPVGVLGLDPQPPANGTIVYDALLGIKGMLKEPVKLIIKDGWVAEVQGGEEAEWLKALLAKMKRQGVDSATYFSEIMWGLNPKASIAGGLELIHLREAELTRRAGTLHFGIGKPGKGFHWDGVLIKPFSVFVDNEPIIENARVLALDDPEVRELAKKYGDPDEVLAEVP